MCTAFVSCNKETVSLEDEPVGEKVILCVNAGGDAGTKVIGALNNKTKGIDFTWESDDEIKVTCGGESSTFSLKSGAGTASAVFEGTMPGTEGTFDVQFPVDEPDLTSQDYEANALPHNKMKATATGCTLGSSVTLTPSYAALRLNLYGEDMTVRKIVVTNTTEETQPSYTLSCGASGVEIGDTMNDSTAFFIVLPSGSYNFTADVYRGDLTCQQLSPSNAQTFKAGAILNMPARKIEPLCLATGTRITMADGTFKNVENIVKGDVVRTFDHEAGRISSARVCQAWKGDGKCVPLSLTFASGKQLSIVGTHDLHCESTRKYVRINSTNAADYVGKRFYNAEAGAWDTLVSYEIGKQPVEYYCIYTAKHMNCLTEGMLSCPDYGDYVLNIYEMDENLKADAAQLAADIAKYGLLDVERDFPECIQYKDIMEDLGCQYIYIAVGKGLIPESAIETIIAYCCGV